MQTIKYKKYIIMSFVVACLLLIMQAIVFWNVIANNKKSPGIWPFLLLIIALLALGYMFSVFLKTTNSEQIEAAINNKVAEERAKILKDLEKNDNLVQEDDQEIYIENTAKELIPKGNFKNLPSLIEKFLNNIANTFEIVQGIVYIKEKGNNEFIFSSGYALTSDKKPDSFKPGETLPGQVAISNAITYINDIPENYFFIFSGLGQSKPKQLTFIPLLLDNEVFGIIEIATFKPIEGNNRKILEKTIQNISTKMSQTIKS